jgi:Txe/YoeB family toxin of Txe-Axe toxin-antitoxin module
MPFFRELTEFEKIDRIYTNLERQKWSRRIGILTRIVLILGLYYGYHWINQPENAQIKAEITQREQQKLAEFIAPLVQDLMKTVLANMGNMGE